MAAGAVIPNQHGLWTTFKEIWRLSGHPECGWREPVLIPPGPVLDAVIAAARPFGPCFHDVTGPVPMTFGEDLRAAIGLASDEARP